jgi:hypothetical protein
LGFLGGYGAGALPPWIVPVRDAGPTSAFTAADQKGEGKEGARGFDVAAALAALGSLASRQQAPPSPPPPDWAPMPRPSAMMTDLRNAPRLAQPPLMPAPQWMQPYLWGVR